MLEMRNGSHMYMRTQEGPTELLGQALSSALTWTSVQGWLAFTWAGTLD